MFRSFNIYFFLNKLSKSVFERSSFLRDLGLVGN